MMSLKNSQNQILLSELKVASRFKDRAVGLLSYRNLEKNEGLWIHRCNSIHTFFMRFSIDCIFLTKEKKVCRVVCRIAPWRLIWPIWTADSVIEVAAGVAEAWNLREGDVLYVSH